MSDVQKGEIEVSNDVANPATSIPFPNRDFVTILVGQGVSAIGTGVTITALPLLVVGLTGSGKQMALVGVLQTLPNIVMGLLAGAIADRWDRRKIMLYADLGRAVLIALIPLAFLLKGPIMPIVFLVTAPIAVLNSFFLAADAACVPSLVGREHIGKATAYLQTMAAIGLIVGPGIAGVLTTHFGPAQAMTIDAASFLVSAISLLLIRRPLQASLGEKKTSILQGIKEGLSYTIGHGTLRPLLTFWGAFAVCNMLLVPVATFFVTKDRGLSASQFGFIVSTYAVAGLPGFAIASFVSDGRRRLGIPMLLGSIVFALGLVAMALVSPLYLLYVAAFVAGCASAYVNTVFVTMRTGITPDHLLGRVSSITELATDSLTPIGMLAGGFLLDLVGGKLTLIAVGGLALLASTVGLLVPGIRGGETVLSEEELAGPT